MIYLSREQIREVDRRAIEEYGIAGVVLMENAGRGCVDTLCSLGVSGPVVVCCGRGNNAGDGFVIARHLDLRGYEVRVILFCESADLRGDAAANFAILAKCGVPIRLVTRADDASWETDLDGADWIVDALLGTGSRGQPRPPLDRVIQCLNQQPARRLAVDLPSGLDCDTGEPAPTTFRADHTCTFVAAKTGFAAPAARECLGQIHVLDIGAPRNLIAGVAGESGA
ncbi:MAG TPA: NAD(P)H-hydrate epimerase [Candidatus Anammoximicrobium sp.]|nr:NAD(P)H-hydrate epimerase [Candidatus Anammoximicrobium sp.]